VIVSTPAVLPFFVMVNADAPRPLSDVTVSAFAVVAISVANAAAVLGPMLRMKTDDASAEANSQLRCAGDDVGNVIFKVTTAGANTDTGIAAHEAGPGPAAGAAAPAGAADGVEVDFALRADARGLTAFVVALDVGVDVVAVDVVGATVGVAAAVVAAAAEAVGADDFFPDWQADSVRVATAAAATQASALVAGCAAMRRPLVDGKHTAISVA
jgi:hypothetical protein